MIQPLHTTVFLGALMVAVAGPSVRERQPVPPVAAAAPATFGLGTATRLRRAGFPGPVEAQLTRVIDGDTFEARIRIWFGQEITTLVRIRGIDAPERKSRCQQEADGARNASEMLAELLGSATIQLQDIALDKFGGRVLASVTIRDPAAADETPENVASLMLATGMARPYAGGRRQGWCGSGN